MIGEDEKMKPMHYSLIASIFLIITSVLAVIYAINNPHPIHPQVVDIQYELVKVMLCGVIVRS